MILRYNTLLLPLIVLLIGMIFGAIAANVFADDSLNKTTDNPPENIGRLTIIDSLLLAIPIS